MKAALVRAIVAVLATAAGGALAGPADPEAVEQPAAVVIDGKALFRVHGMAAQSAEERAQRISDRIAEAGADRAVDAASVRVAGGPAGTEILAGARRLMLVTDADADPASPSSIASIYRTAIVEAIERYRADRSPAVLGRALLRALGIAVGLALVVGLFVFLGRRLDVVLEERLHRRIHDVRIKSFKLLDAELIWNVLRGMVRTVRALLIFATCFVGVGFSLRQFPWTRGAVTYLVSSLAQPLLDVARAVFGAVPDLIVLALVVMIVRWVLRVARLFFAAVENGAVPLRGFEREWATPTYRLVRVAVVAFALVVAYPYIPGSRTDAFKAISILAGVLLSLGSTSVLSSIIAGYAMTYRRTFRLGDRVRIGNVLGDVQEIGLMVTRLRTVKNEEAVIPNSTILQAEVLNYSAHAREGGVILHARVGIGYEVPWRQVEAMLLVAADRTRGLLREPRPFVLQLDLADFCVNYELNVYCADPRLMLELYTELHRNVLDAFNEYGVQIMTPAYQRDPAQPKIVPREKWYDAPAQMEPADPGGHLAPSAAAAK